MSLLQKSWMKLFLIGLALASVTAFAFWPVHNCEFINYDDGGNVFKNEIVQQGVNFKGVAWAFTIGEPLTMVSHMLVCHLFGLDAGAHHLVNLLFHVLNTFLLFFLFHKMTGALWRSAFVAALFALHPLHVESVAWVSGRTDLLSIFFGLLTIWFYARYVDESKTPSLKAKGFYGLSLVLFACGLLSKSILVTLPCVLLLLDYWPLNRISLSTVKPRAAKLLLEKIPFFLLVVGMSIFAFSKKTGIGAIVSLADLPMLERIKNALVAYVMYLVKTFCPTDLSILYPIQHWPISRVFVAAMVLLVISMVVVKLASRRPYLLVGWLWYLGILVPTVGLIQAGTQSMADRYTYLSLIGIFIMIAWGTHDLFRAPKFRVPLWTVAIVILVLCTALTRAQVAHWRTSETLFEHALRSTKRNSTILCNLGALRMEQGRLDEAVALLTESLAIFPDDMEALNNLAAAFGHQGKHEAARKIYGRLLEINPESVEAHFSIGASLLFEGDYGKAIPHLLAATRLRPDLVKARQLLAQAHYNVGNTYLFKGQIGEAIPHYQNAVDNWPDHAEAQNNLAQALLKLGKPDAALPHAEKAVQLNPDLAEARYNLSEILLRLGKFAEAEKHARAGIALRPNEPALQDVLGRALAGQKK